MKWHEKFKVGQKVKVVAKVKQWVYGNCRVGWNDKYMDKTIGKVYEIKAIDKRTGFQLRTQLPVDWDNTLYDYYYPVESLEEVRVKGRQLLFNFMTE